MDSIDIAMIFAAGRGERMRPLTDHTPKPLLAVGGKALIVRQIEALAAAGIRRIVINHAWLGEQFATALGDGSRWGVQLAFSDEGTAALETAGGIAKALPLLRARHWGADRRLSAMSGLPAQDTTFIAVAGDVFCDFDYRRFAGRALAMQQQPEPGMHLVLVPNPAWHAQGDFAFDGERLHSDGPQRLTFASFGIYDTRMFAALAAQTPLPRMPLLPFFRDAIAAGRATAEVWHGEWENVGTVAGLDALNARLQPGL